MPVSVFRQIGHLNEFLTKQLEQISARQHSVTIQKEEICSTKTFKQTTQDVSSSSFVILKKSLFILVAIKGDSVI
jgi:hypothetical protein